MPNTHPAEPVVTAMPLALKALSAAMGKGLRRGFLRGASLKRAALYGASLSSPEPVW
jgi:hypothetical protein